MTESGGRRKALELAMKAVGQRERSTQELRRFLAQRGVEPEVIDGAVAEFGRAGLVDDAAYAVRFTEDRRLLDRWGTERIARELERRGIERELIEAALGGIEPADEMAAAIELLDRRFPLPFASDRDRDKAWRLLVRRGYEPELAYAAVRAHERGTERRAAA